MKAKKPSKISKPKTSKQVEKEVALKDAMGPSRKKAVRAQIKDENKKSPHLVKVFGSKKRGDKKTYG